MAPRKVLPPTPPEPSRGSAPKARRPAATRTRQRLDLLLFGATGYTGRQAVRALLEQRPDAHWGVAGRNAARLQALVDELVPAGARAPRLIVADAHDAAALRAMAAQTRVLFNLAGPYHAHGDAVVAACIAAATHYLDLSGETFWMQRLVREQHDAARRADVTHQGAVTLGKPDRPPHPACHAVRCQAHAQARPLGGLAALLAHDHSGCVADMACLLPPEAGDAPAVAQRNALGWLPRYDAALQAVLGPALPGPFINPPVVLRGVALIDDATLFTPRFRYREGSDLRSVLPGARWLPTGASLALQWAGAAALAAPLAQLRATLTGPLQFQRAALGALLQRVAPQPGSGPREAALDAIGYELEVLARGARGARFRGLVSAQGHPGYRSTPRMTVCAALGLADGSLGRTPHCGIVPPAAALGIETVAALQAAGASFKPAA